MAHGFGNRRFCVFTDAESNLETPHPNVGKMNVFETLTINSEKYIKNWKNTHLKIFESWVWQSELLKARSAAQRAGTRSVPSASR